jgi:hypothetical protein
VKTLDEREIEGGEREKEEEGIQGGGQFLEKKGKKRQWEGRKGNKFEKTG